MNRTAAIITMAAFFTGCTGQAELGAGDYADAGTTAVGVSMGLTEANPIIGAAGNAAAPIVALGAKLIVKDALIQAGHDPKEVNRSMNNVSAGYACANVATIAAVALPAALLMGGACYVIAEEINPPEETSYYVVIDPRTGEKRRVEKDQGE